MCPTHSEEVPYEDTINTKAIEQSGVSYELRPMLFVVVSYENGFRVINTEPITDRLRYSFLGHINIVSTSDNY